MNSPYTWEVEYSREWGKIHSYFHSKAEAERAEESGRYAGCGAGTVKPCYRDGSLSDYESEHWYR